MNSVSTVETFEISNFGNEVDDDRRSTVHHLSGARRLLYVSHCFAQISDSVWQFSVILFLTAFSNYKSLLLISTYGLACQMSVCLFGASAGRLIDRSNRLVLARVLLCVKKGALLVATLLCYVLLGRLHHTNNDLSSEDDIQSPSSVGVPVWNVMSVTILVAIHLFGSLAAVLDSGFLVAIERDWLVVMSQVATDTQKQWLSRTNVIMKRIDSVCQSVVPAVTGFVVASFDTKSTASPHVDLIGAVVLVTVTNGISCLIEYGSLSITYYRIPELSFPPQAEQDTPDHNDTNDSPLDEPDALAQGTAVGIVYPTNVHGRVTVFLRAFGIYFEQAVAPAGMALALLFVNSLTFGGLMTGYLLSRGMGVKSIGIWRGVSSAMGLAGTFAYDISLQRGVSLIATGMWSIASQWSCLSVSLLALFAAPHQQNDQQHHHHHGSLIILIGSVCCSRLGLWAFDITVTQLMQEYIPVGIRGTIGGMQKSWNAFFELLSFGLALIFSDPRDFPLYGFVSYTAVTIALLLYLLGIYQRQYLLLYQ